MQTRILTLVTTLLLSTHAGAAGEHGGHHGHASDHPGDHHGGHAGWNIPPEASKRPNPFAPTEQSLQRGAAIYREHCAVCHGPNLAGDGPIADQLDPRPADLSMMAGMHPQGDFAWMIAEGRGAMPSWRGQLSEEDIWHTVNFLYAEAGALDKPSGMHGHGSHHDSSGGAGHAPMHEHGAHPAPEQHMHHTPADPPEPTPGSAQHGHGAHHSYSGTEHGPWSYRARELAAPHSANRWEAIPAGMGGMMFVPAANERQLCAALEDNARIMVDRATRARCAGGPNGTGASTPDARPQEHSGHPHH